MYYDLKMVFLTTEGDEYSMIIKNVKSTIASLVPAMMQNIISSNAVFTKDGDLVSAKKASLIKTALSSVSI